MGLWPTAGRGLNGRKSTITWAGGAWQSHGWGSPEKQNQEVTYGWIERGLPWGVGEAHCGGCLQAGGPGEQGVFQPRPEVPGAGPWESTVYVLVWLQRPRSLHPGWPRTGGRGPDQTQSWLTHLHLPVLFRLPWWEPSTVFADFNASVFWKQPHRHTRSQVSPAIRASLISANSHIKLTIPGRIPFDPAIPPPSV